jgi:glycosyltransferase involved in cell wall biosynthesis
MGAGLPVVSSGAGGVPELFEDPEHGRFWPIDDPRRGAEILVDLLESEQELRRAGRAALERFRSDYDAEVVAPRLVQFLGSAPGSSVESRPASELLPVPAVAQEAHDEGGDHGHD